MNAINDLSTTVNEAAVMSANMAGQGAETVNLNHAGDVIGGTSSALAKLGVAAATAGAAGVAAAALPAMPSSVAAVAANGRGTEEVAASSAKSETVASKATAITDKQAASFLLQAQISCTKADIAHVKKLGYAGWLSSKMNTGQQGVTGWNWLLQNGYNRSAIMFSRAYADPMIWAQLMNPADGLRKRVALALSEIFVISTTGMTIESPMFAMAGYWDLLMRNAFGNFRTLLGEIALNPAMGNYLTILGSEKTNAATGKRPDQNFARELLQLFTIGVHELQPNGIPKTSGGRPIETYTADTVASLAHVFTGYELNKTGHVAASKPEVARNPMKVNLSKHSQENVRIFGVTIPGTLSPSVKLNRALDVIFKHPNVGPFIGLQLIQRLVKSSPSPAYVARVAAAFNNNGKGVRGDMRHVIAAVLLDSEARFPSSTDNWSGKMREPMVRFAQWGATFGAKPKPGDTWRIFDLTDKLGQSPLRPDSVFGYFRPEYVPPNTLLAGHRKTAPEFRVTDETSAATFINTLSGYMRDWYPIVGTYTTELSLATNPAALVQHLNLILAGGQLSPRIVSLITAAVTNITTAFGNYRRERVTAAVVMIMSCAEYTIQK